MTDIRFFYHRYSANKNRVLTVARKLDENKMIIGWSICNPKDQFSKKMGRKIALSRLENVPLEAQLIPGETRRSLTLALNAIVNEVDRDESFDAHFLLNAICQDALDEIHFRETVNENG